MPFRIPLRNRGWAENTSVITDHDRIERAVSQAIEGLAGRRKTIRLEPVAIENP